MHRYLIARALLWLLGVVYRSKSRQLAWWLRDLADEYDPSPVPGKPPGPSSSSDHESGAGHRHLDLEGNGAHELRR